MNTINSYSVLFLFCSKYYEIFKCLIAKYACYKCVPHFFLGL